MDNNHIEDEGVKAIADALKANPFLQELGILSNNIGEKGGKYILNTLYQIGVSAIENIDLRWNQISSRTEGRINQEMIRIKYRYKGVGANEGKTAANATAVGEPQGVSNGDEGMSTIHTTNASQVSAENVQETIGTGHNTIAVMETEVEGLKSTIAKQQDKIAEQDKEITSMKEILKTNGEIVCGRHGGTTSNASNDSIPNLAIASIKDIMKTIGYMVNRRTTSNISNDDLIPDRETELQSEIERYKQENHSLKEKLKNSRPIETIDLTNEIEPASSSSSSSDGDDSSEEEPPSKRRRMKSNLAVALEVTQQMVKVKEEKKRVTVAEANVASARREKDAAEASLRDVQEDLEDSEELVTQQAVATNILQGRIDELCELARAAGVDGNTLSEIRYRPLSSGR